MHTHSFDNPLFICKCSMSKEQFFNGEIAGPINRHNDEVFKSIKKLFIMNRTSK